MLVLHQVLFTGNDNRQAEKFMKLLNMLKISYVTLYDYMDTPIRIDWRLVHVEGLCTFIECACPTWKWIVIKELCKPTEVIAPWHILD